MISGLSNNRVGDGRAPWWAWVGPACTFLLFLAVFWPRPYAIRAGDGLAYYSGARYIAAQGRYYEDYTQRPAVPLLRHPPLFSMLWGALLYVGVGPIPALWLIHAMFLFGMGAAGGALAYHITRSWTGPLLWTIFSCCWPGGDNWVFWVRPLTETGTAAFFVIVCWMLSRALRAVDRCAILWLLLASAVAGLSMILKITGAFCFPVVGIVSVMIFPRGKGWSRWWVVTLSVVLMLLPYGLWALRNVMITGTIEAGKISHLPELTWGLMAHIAADAAEWFMPAQLAQRLSAGVHPLVIMIPVVLLPAVLTVYAGYRKCPEAILAGACVSIAFAALGVMMITKFTEETRYWSVMLPCLALAALVLSRCTPTYVGISRRRGTSGPAHRLSGRVFRIIAALFVMFCCARFAVTRPYLWYATEFGFYVQQGVLAGSLIGGLFYLHSVTRGFWKDHRRLSAHLVAMVVCGLVAAALWRFGHTPKPIWAFVPLALTGVIISLPLGSGRGGTVLRGLGCMLPAAISWWLGGWAWVEPVKPLMYELDGIAVEVREDVYRARQILAQGEWPAKFVSNGEEYLIDLFGDHSVLPLPWYRSIARFRSNLPQLPEDDERMKREWIAALRRDGVTEPFVMVMFPQFAARSYFYGPEDFDPIAELKVDWKVHDPDVHIAICRLVPDSM